MAILRAAGGFPAPSVVLRALCLSALTASGSLPAQTADEYGVKAAVLSKLASFVEWPGESRPPICIGVLGRDPFGKDLDEVVKGKYVNGKELQVRRFKASQDPSDCQIVFIGVTEKPDLRARLDRLHAASVLTVGDFAGFCEAGGIINLSLAGERVRLDVNLAAAAAARLHLSSKLLSLATIVRPAPQDSR